MSVIYLSMPYAKEDDFGDIKKDIDESLISGLANGYILNDTQLHYLNQSNSTKVVLIDRIRKRRADGTLSQIFDTNSVTRFGKRHNLKVIELVETTYSPEVFKYHRTGVKIISASGQDVK